MDTKDLMIGDWVSHNGTPKTVDVIWGKEVSLNDPTQVWGSIYTDKFNEDEIEPIPLTPEILKKNFPSTTDWYFIGIDKFCFRIDKYKDKWDLYFGRDGKGTNLQIKISYVHELQHALRLCGINKEIQI